VRFAFHFVDEGAGWDEPDAALFSALLQSRTRNAVIRRGNISQRLFGSGTDQILENALYIQRTSRSTFEDEDYVRLVATKDQYVQVVEGLTQRQGQAIHRSLDGYVGYSGALSPRLDDRMHWIVYHSTLPTTYRLAGTELRLCWRSFESDDDEYQQQRRDHWRRVGLFESVALEDLGVRDTVLDAYDSHEHSALTARTEEMLSEYVGEVAAEVALSASDLDPRLVQGLHSALRSLATAANSEDLAQAALACRRFLERLANHLFPPTTERRGGRNLRQAEWKNRLWAYVEDSLDEGPESERLAVIGARIDWVANQTSVELHRLEVERSAVKHLIVEMIALFSDLVLLHPLPVVLPKGGYETEAQALLEEMLGWGNNDPAQ
jgi:hypothetical protein